MASNTHSRFTGLILISGEESPLVAHTLFETLAPFAVKTLDIKEISLRGRIILMAHIELDPAHAEAIEADLLVMSEKLGIDVAVDYQESDPANTVRANSARVVVLAPSLSPKIFFEVSLALRNHSGHIASMRKLSSEPFTAFELTIHFNQIINDIQSVRRELAQLSISQKIDICIEESTLDRSARRFVLLDMDSTLIQQEVIDLLAAKAGVQSEVAAITERAMAGELDFEASLKERVHALTGLSESAISEVAKEIRLSPGAEILINSLHKLGHFVGVVSGGFSNVIAPLLETLEVDFYRANTLEIVDGKLTGKVVGKIIDRAAKADALKEFAQQQGIPLAHTIAIGDGANDLDMVAAAGLGVAYNAKAALREKADTSISVPNLDALLYLMGYDRLEIEATSL